MHPSEPLSEDHQPSHSSAEEPSVEEFQFLCCQSCRREAKCPKLLPCLHSVCSGCLRAPDMQCPICKVPAPPDADPPILDNVFFESLQRYLALYRQVVDENARCTRCKERASFWCSQCEQLLCPQCYEAHRYYLKHETQPLGDIRRQPMLEFLDSMRKPSNIFCSRSHPEPILTNIYCRDCAKPLCCSCAILDEAHKDSRCDIRVEIEQRQRVLDSMTQVLCSHEAALGGSQTQLSSAVHRLDQLRADAEGLVRARTRQLLEFVRARERELLQAVSQRHQHAHDEVAGRLQGLDAMLQRIRTGSELVRSMKRLASDQEVLDMHNFLSQALQRLLQEVPGSPEATVCVDGFDEVKARLQDLVARVTQGVDLPALEEASPEVASTPPTCPEEASTPPTCPSADMGSEVQADTQPVTVVPSLQAQDVDVQVQPEAVVQPMPDAHPVPVHAFSIGSTSSGEEDAPLATSQKRKAPQTESPRKLARLQSEERAGQPQPSTSQAVSLPLLEEFPSPGKPPVEDKDSVPHSNHLASDPKEAGPAALSPPLWSCPESECPSPLPMVVISSSEESSSDGENSNWGDPDKSSIESSDEQLEGPNSLRTVEDALTNPRAEDGPLVFFDLRIDVETQKISQLAAVNGESKFRALISSQASFSACSKTVSLEVGLEHFLRFLGTLRRPVLACYRLWGPSLPHFFRALEDVNQLWALREVTSGFLAMLPLFREHLPGADSFQLRSLAKTYLARNMSESSALASVLTMRDLCRLLEVAPGPQLAPHVHSFGSLHCFASLQPLVRAAVLPRPEARLLALHNVDLTELRRAHQRDPQGGLQRYSHYLSQPEAQGTSTSPASILQALSSYLGGLPQSPTSAGAEGPGTPIPSSGHGSDAVRKTPQRS